MFLNYHYCHRAAIPVKRVRSPRHRDNNNYARLWIANLARPSAALDDKEDNEKDEDSRYDAWRTFASPANESTKYRPYTLAPPRLVIIKRYKREADCARLIAPLWRTNACETKREKLYGHALKNDSSSWRRKVKRTSQNEYSIYHTAMREVRDLKLRYQRLHILMYILNQYWYW